MNITYNEIYELCNYENAFFKGMAYFNNDCVKSKRKMIINSSEEYIEAKVRGSHMYNVSIWVEDGKVVQSLCDCPAFEKYDGVCKHIAAVLFSCLSEEKIVDSVYDDRVSSGNFLRSSSALASAIINNYKSSEIKDSFSYVTNKAELYPMLHLKSNNRISVEFKIDFGKKYVIKDLCEFSDNVKFSRQAYYGKNTSFEHNINAFSQKAKKYIDIINEAVLENRIFNYCYNKYSYFGSLQARELELTPHLLDKFMEVADGDRVEFEANSIKNTYEIISENPRLNFTFSKSADGLVMVETEKYMHFSGNDSLYIIMDNFILKTDSDYKEKMGGYIDAGSNFLTQGKFTVSEADMIFFYNNIIPKLSVYSNIFTDDIDLSKYEMPAPEVGFYIDLTSIGSVSAKCEILYGEKKINPFKQLNVQSFRDTALEYSIKNVLQKYFHYTYENEGVFETLADEDAVFDFAATGIEELRSFGEIFVSDSFKKLSIHPAPKISVGLSLRSELLELEFFSDEFDLRELRKLLKSYQSKKKYYRLKDGSFITLEDSELSKLAEAADTLKLYDFQSDKDGASFSLPKYRSLYLDKLFSGESSVARDYSFRALIRNIKTAEDSEFEIPESLKKVLRSYQKHGFRWLKTMDMYGFGGILADDMGLGKTLQVISLLLSEKETKVALGESTESSLIVCPASLIYNWESEIQKFAPSLASVVITGSSAERMEKLQESDGFDIVITSYDLLKRDAELYKEKNFRFQIIDEAQYIKNSSTQSAKAVKSIKAKNKFALTGTPIENRLSELWSIFDFLMPGFLFSYTRFRKELEQPAVKDGDENALKKIKNMVSPFILRRLKTDVLKELPEKNENVLVSQMGDEQRKLYMANIKALKDTIEKNNSSSIKEDTIRILAMLTRLRQICCDPSLCYEDYKNGSAKLESCIDLIKEATSGGHKILLFSQFTSMLEIIENRLEEEGIKYYSLVGATPKEQRLSLVNSFQTNDVPVFLISLKSGGTGLNLTSADIVIHYDPWWNIAAQNQATDRTHRIGQKNIVTVYKLIAKDTIEEKILKLQESKKQLADSVITENGINIADMSKDELIALLDA